MARTPAPMTLARLAERHPELIEEARAEGRAVERARIEAVYRGASMVDLPAPVVEAMFRSSADPKTAAIAVLAAMRVEAALDERANQLGIAWPPLMM